MKVCFIGMGYIGCPTACIIARADHDVVGVELNQDNISILKNGDIHIKNEEGLLRLYQLVKNKVKCY
jgi:UDP-N-acetyl-D-mannosaminuronic acid dehydrogenase